MIPFELEQKSILISKSADFSIVIVSDDSISGERNALRIREVFGERVVRWFRITPNQNAPSTSTKPSGSPREQKNRVWSLINRARFEKWEALSTLYRAFQRKRVSKKYSKQFSISEENFQSETLLQLRKKHSDFAPTDLSKAQLTDGTLTSMLKGTRPFLFISFFAPIEVDAFLSLGFEFSLHVQAGISPSSNGINAVFDALYHRELQQVFATVILQKTNESSYLICRHSHPLVHPCDSAEVIFWRTQNLGTELLISVINEIDSKEEINVFLPSKTAISNAPNSPFDHHKSYRMKRDFVEGWLAQQLQEQYTF